LAGKPVARAGSTLIGENGLTVGVGRMPVGLPGAGGTLIGENGKPGLSRNPVAVSKVRKRIPATAERRGTEKKRKEAKKSCKTKKRRFSKEKRSSLLISLRI
jgi:hypothetical protein